jgi:hypothetical protein
VVSIGSSPRIVAKIILVVGSPSVCSSPIGPHIAPAFSRIFVPLSDILSGIDITMATFKHSPLHDSSSQIRLLDLQPGQHGDLLEVSIRQVQLSDNPSYEALSYTWGTERASHQISIDGVHFAVRPNLFHCLNELRLQIAIRTLWIDAICIDQTNIEERNHQVQEMRKIYAQATLVRIWAGYATSWTKDLFEYMNTSKAERASLTWPSLDNESILFDEEVRATPLAYALLDICSREYWKRAWILQEVMISRKKVLHCGPYSTPWNVFCTTINTVEHSFTSSVLRQTRQTPVYRLSEIPNSQIGSSSETQREQLNLEDLLERFGESACGDIRDRVYALLGLAKDCTIDHPFLVNYDENECILFFRTIIFCKAKNPLKFASRVLHVLGIDKVSLQQYVRSSTQEIKEKQLKVKLPAYYFGTASYISTSGLEDNKCFRWKRLKQVDVLGKLIARGVTGRPAVPPSSHEIKIFQIEGFAIGILLTSITEEEDVAFIPVVIQQVEGSVNEELHLYRASDILHYVAIKGGNSFFNVNLFVQPESFLWLIVESEKWKYIKQPWDKGRRREIAERSKQSSSQFLAE